MRLVVIGPHFPEYCLRYAAAMARHGHVLVVVDGAQMDAEYAGRPPPASMAGLTIERNGFRTPWDLVRLVWQVARFRPDAVHMQEAVGPRRAGFLACVAGLQRRRARIALTIHDPKPHAGRDEAVARRSNGMRAYVRGMAHVLVAHGEHCTGLVRAAARNGQVVVASAHGVILSPAVVSPVPGPPLRLFMFGRMEAYKGLEILLGALERLDGDGLAVQVELAGQGPEINRLGDRFRRLPGVVVHASFVPPAVVVASIQACHCVLLPYLSATQSGVLAAAFAGGRGVIASDTGGLADVVIDGRNGLLVPPGDVAALAQAIALLAAEPALASALGHGAATTAAGPLNWDVIGEALLPALCTKQAARSSR